MKIAIIGAGNLGISIAKGLLDQKQIHKLYLTKRNTDTLAKKYAKNPLVCVTADNKEAVVLSKIIILAVQPGHLPAILQQIQPFITQEHLIISTITGYSIAQIENQLSTKHKIVRAMPNTAIAIGKSMTCICHNQSANTDIDIAYTIFNALGATMAIEEEQMQAATVICASAIAFWMRLIRATTQGAIQLGFESDKALEMATYTCLGAASLLESSKNHPEQEIDKVTTPKGCTIEGLNEMEHQGLSASLIKGIVASFEKINSIKKDA